MSEDTARLERIEALVGSIGIEVREAKAEMREMRDVILSVRDWKIAQEAIAPGREEDRRTALKGAALARENRARLHLLEMGLPTGERPSLPPASAPVVAETDRAVAVAVAPQGEPISATVIKIAESTPVRVFAAGCGIVIVVTALSCAGGVQWTQLEGYITRVAGAVAGAPVGPPVPPSPLSPSPAP